MPSVGKAVAALCPTSGSPAWGLKGKRNPLEGHVIRSLKRRRFKTISFNSFSARRGPNQYPREDALLFTLLFCPCLRSCNVAPEIQE
jgi:hypothetical protein